MPDKYHMLLQDNVNFAKRNLIDSIYKEAVIEGINVTFPRTQAIIEGVTEGMERADIVKIINLKYAWQFVLDSIEYAPVGVSYIRVVNGKIQRDLSYDAGRLRTFNVRISGTKWVPAMPSLDAMENDLLQASQEASDTDRALCLMLKIMRGQYFEDGNKRTAQLVANHELIRKGRGVVAIPPDKKDQFGKLLVSYYENNSQTKIMDFLYNYCLQGINRGPSQEPFDVEAEAKKFLKKKPSD